MHRGRLRRVNALLLVVLIAVAALNPFASAFAQQSMQEGHGVNTADMDLAVDPAVDFYRYANGGWLDRTVIPDDFASIETMSDLDGRTRAQLIDLLIRRDASGDVQTGSDEWKAIRLFQQGTDLSTRNAQGVEPIEPILTEIAAIDNLGEFHTFLQGSVFLSVPGLFYVSAGPDLKDSATTVAYLNGPSIGLPRDYYLADDPGIDLVREAYLASGSELLTLIGRDAASAGTDSRAVYEFEATLAEHTLSREEAQDFSRIYNPTSPADLATLYPSMDWPAYLSTLGLDDVSRLLVVEPRYMNALDAIVGETPLPVLKDYLTLQLLRSSSANLSEAMENASFALYGTAMNGLTVQAPIEGRTLDQVSHFLGDAVGKLYVDAYFSPEAKAQSDAMVQNLIAAFHSRLEGNSWMTPPTKANALAKLGKLRVKVGYPETWKSYDDVTITDSYFASALSAFNAFYRDSLSDIGDSVDKDAWPFPPQTVNAMYNPLNNEIVIPAAMLQPPFFDPAADPASNFGAIGYVIGHEITHGFDLQGSQFDGDGNLENWWTGEDQARFEALNDRLAEQYSQIEVADGVNVDGGLTIGENVADLGGIQVAYDALQLHLAQNGQTPEADTGDAEMSQEQRFFVAAATVWRAEVREEALMTQLLSDPHAPAAVRGTQPLRNCASFHDAFAIDESEPMYLPRQDRVVIW